MKARPGLCQSLLILTLAAVAAPAAGAAPATSIEDPAAARKALDGVAKRLNALDEWFSDAGRQRVRWEKDLQTKDNEVAKVAREVEEAAGALRAVEQDLRRLTSEQQELEKQRATQAQHIADHLAAAYRMSGEDFVKLLLNQQSPDTVDRMVRYHRYFTEARLEALEAYQQTLDALAENRFQLETRAAAEQEKRDALATRQRALIREREERKAHIAELNVEMEDKTAERKRLEADRARLEQLFAELKSRASKLDGTGFKERKRALPWPLTGKVAHGFGQPRADGRLVWHGMVINAEEGTPVQAVFRGRVVFANWLRGFGLLTILDHGGGYMTLYGHADVLTKTVGESVESGETIARAGRSGGQQTSGLYFEVRQEGVAQDPIAWLQKR
ncbi:MAG: peptidoglycan DD-metalloendopeptidase family protein [Pseudomonadales bacterium]